MYPPGARVSWKGGLLLMGLAVALPCGPLAHSQEVCTDALDNDGDGFVDCADLDCCAEPPCAPIGCARFRRGDVDGDGRRTVMDAILILLSLFAVDRPLSCGPAADLDDGDTVDIADAIHLLRYVFQGGPEPPPPLLECELDPTQGDLSCDLGFPCA